MKFLISCLFATAMLVFSFGCHPKLLRHTSINKESVDSRGNPMLLGQCKRESLAQKPFSDWFLKNYRDYAVDTAIAGAFGNALKGKHFIIFMGTWCGDSKREVPRMFKLFDYCGVKSSQVDLVMLDNRDSVYKQSPDHDEVGFNIHRVPDLIVYDKNVELGRIVESPVVSIEKDLAAIINYEQYTPHYQAVSYLIRLFNEKGNDDLISGLDQITKQVKPLVSGAGELNTYGFVLMAAKQMDKAKIAFELNTRLYPEDANVFDSFGEYYLKVNDKRHAKENYQRVLRLQPDNANAKKMMLDL
jgi:tetratricopeptide (TPR) repeat protein